MIKQGDCLELIKDLPDGSVDCIITDPPYFTGMTHGYGDKPRMLDLNICRPFYLNLFEEFMRVPSAKGCLYWFCDWRSMGFYLSVMETAKLPVKNCLVWNKGGGAGNFYRYVHEHIIFATRQSKIICRGTNVIDGILGFSANHKIDGGKVHQAQKPVSLIEKLMADGSQEGDTVLDCFMGSGTAGVACVNLNRNFIGFEIDEKYFEIAQRRIDEAIAQREQSLF